MQDDARPHRTAEVFDVLSDRVVALDYEKHTQSGMDWPPFFPDLTPCDFFLWEYLKDQVHCHNPQTLAELEQYTSAAIVRPFQLKCLHWPQRILSSNCATLLLQMLVIWKTSFYSFPIQQRHLLTNFVTNFETW
ncbi:hypothetical protein AVEN_79655-1 [Araneus ventricosus]|uniref:Tc1-like transposase DDE domain-containing protein n=1 Tax=Araneus ventricosus TaxID=182803 RepID=A0A4Y2T8R4_ARAVE|nr:hypothetical protein AVEN_79655-1 [Araneus ventricosus]